MVEKGIDSVSVSAVAKKAGITRPGAYYHFKSRGALLETARNEIDRQLVRTVVGGKDDEYLYSQAAVLAAEDQDMIYLRIQRMLEQGPNDVIVRSGQRGIGRLKRENHVQPGVDPDVAAIIISTSLISSFLAVSEFKQRSRRHRQAKIFGKTHYELLFHGALAHSNLTHWPELPRYSVANADTKIVKAATNLEVQDARKAKSLVTRELLIKATMQLMAEVGVGAVSVSEVARRAGITRPGAYYHFKNKEALIAATKSKIDKELIYTLDRLFTTRKSFTNKPDLSIEDLSLLKIRIQQMLAYGAKNDPLIAHYRKLFYWHKKRGHMREGLDPNITAIIVACASLVGLFLVLLKSDAVEARTRLAKRFHKTYKIFVSEGIFKPGSNLDWPPPPDTDYSSINSMDRDS